MLRACQFLSECSFSAPLNNLPCRYNCNLNEACSVKIFNSNRHPSCFLGLLMVGFEDIPHVSSESQNLISMDYKDVFRTVLSKKVQLCWRTRHRIQVFLGFCCSVSLESPQLSKYFHKEVVQYIKMVIL